MNLLDSYQRYFRDLFPILRDMSARGIPIDDTRRLELKELIEREDLRVTAAIQQLVPPEVLSSKQKMGLKRVPKDTTGMVEIEVLIGEGEKCQCKKSERGSCALCAGSGIILAGTALRRWAMPVEFNPNSPLQVKRFMKHFGHPIPRSTKKTDAQGEARETTEMKELERLWVRTKHPIYPLLIEKRQLTKVEGTYCEGWTPSRDGCIHTTYTFQTATWQTSSRAPNVQNGLKHGKSPFQKELAARFNSMQKAQSGRILVNFDFKSFHALTTAHDFNVPDYARLARIDIHSFVACQFLRLPEREGLWEREDEDMRQLFKSLRKREEFANCRDVPAKQTILGIQFGRGPRSIYTMYREFFDSESQAKAIHSLVYALFPRLRKGQQEVCARAAEDKRLVNKYGAIRHFYDVTRWDRKQQKFVNGEQAEQAMAFLPASHAFGHMRDVMLRIREQGWDEKYQLVNAIHDSLVFHCPLELADECEYNVKAEMQKPSSVLIYPDMAPAGLLVGADANRGDSIADMKG